MLDNTLAYDKTSRFCFFDLETFNLNLSYRFNRPWQAGLISRIADRDVEVHDLWIKWPDSKLKIGAGAAAVTNYDENVFQSKAITNKEAWPIIYRNLEEADFLIAHNGLNFDIFLIAEWYKENGKDYRHLIPKCIDTKCLSVAYKLGLKKPQNISLFEWQLQFMYFRQKGLKTRLEIMGKEFGIDTVGPLHDAINDLRLNISVFNKLKFSLDL